MLDPSLQPGKIYKYARLGSSKYVKKLRKLEFSMAKRVQLADVDQLVTIKGLMIRASPIVPDMKIAFFQCLVCDQTMAVEVDRGRIAEPTRCPREQCASENTMQLIHNRCTFADKQVTRLQETPGIPYRIDTPWFSRY